MAVTILGAGAATDNGASGATSLVLPAFTTGVGAGDVLVAIFDHRSGSATITPPGSWVEANAGGYGTNTAPSLRARCYTLTLAGAPAASYSFGISSTQTMGGLILALRGLDTSSLVAASNGGSATSTTAVQAPAVSPANGGTLLVGIWGTTASSTTVSTPTGMTSQGTISQTALSARIATQQLTSSGSTGTRDATAGASGTTVGAMWALNQALPAQPTGLSATGASASQINLSWTNPTSTADTLTVERSATGSGGWSAIASGLANNTTSYSDTGLSAGATWFYRVTGVNSRGSGTPSATASATTIPATPTGLAASAVSSSQINVTWNAATGATSYTLERSLTGSGGWSTVYTGATASFSDTGLSASTQYFYRVSASNAAGASAASANADATTQAAPVVVTTTLDSPLGSGTIYELRLADAFGNDLVIIDQYFSCEWARMQNEVGSLTLVLSKDFDAALLQEDYRIYVYRSAIGEAPTLEGNTFWLIRRVVFDDVNDTWTVTAQDTTSLLERRIVDYVAGSAEASKGPQAADDMAKEVILENFGASAGSATGRDVSAYLSIDPDQGAAATISKAFAWRNVLNVLQELAQASTYAGTWMGFDLVPSGQGVVFRTWTGQRGVDRRYPNGINPVLLSAERGNLDPASFSRDALEAATAVTAGGQGEGVARTVARAEDTTKINASPFGRIEQFRQATTSADAAVIQDEADAALRAARSRVIFSGEVKPTEDTIFGRDFGWGDLVTAYGAGQFFDCRADGYRIRLGNNGDREQISIVLRSL